MAHLSTQQLIRREFSPRSLVGLGETKSREQIEAEFWAGYTQAPAASRPRCEYPAWCNWIGAADRFFDSCLPLTEAELRACQAAGFGTTMTPEAREQALRLGDQSVAAYAAAHPAEYAAYQQALTDPNADLKLYAWIAGGVVALVVVVSLLRGRR